MEIKEVDSFKISVEKIQHIKSLEYEINLSQNKLHCIVGKNGVGKTTLIKAIQNFKETDTIDKLSRLNIVQENSKIVYTLDNINYTFLPIQAENRYILDSKDTPPQENKKQLNIEFPAPKGKRFNTYERLGGDIGEDIKTRFAINNYDDKPTELIQILKNIYDSTEYFDNLEQIITKNESYFIKPLNQENYIREDDFSSGEYMIIQIFKLIKKGCKLIVIDELDISLDSRAQINLLQELQNLCQIYQTNILFTTHSLAIMKKINELNENLYYMSNNNGTIDISIHSYNYIKAELFQFTGYDKIILTEDETLKNYLEYLLKNKNIYKIYAIIPCNSESETIKILKTNQQNNIFGTDDIKIILDGDVQDKYKQKQIFSDICFIPFNDLEIECLNLYKNEQIKNDNEINKTMKNIPDEKNRAKFVFEKIISKSILSKTEIFEQINNQKLDNAKTFTDNIIEFLNN